MCEVLTLMLLALTWHPTAVTPPNAAATSPKFSIHEAATGADAEHIKYQPINESAFYSYIVQQL